jgi:hypothetical protein
MRSSFFSMAILFFTYGIPARVIAPERDMKLEPDRHLMLPMKEYQMKRLALSIAKRPIPWALLITLASLTTGACAIVMADFGQPLWLFAPLFLWLGTIGLPTTIGVLAVATCWGRIPGLYGLAPFVLCASVVAFVFQALCFYGCAKMISRHSR